MLTTIWIIIALLLVIEGAFITFSPHKTAILMRRLTKNSRALRLLGLIELIIGIILLFFSIK